MISKLVNSRCLRVMVRVADVHQHSCLNTRCGDNSSSVKALAVNLSQHILWKMTPVCEHWGQHVFDVRLHTHTIRVRPFILSHTCLYVNALWDIHMRRRRMGVWKKYGFKAAWSYLFAKVMIEHFAHTHACTRQRYADFLPHTRPDMCMQTHRHNHSQTNTHTHTHTLIHTVGFIAPLSLGC